MMLHISRFTVVTFLLSLITWAQATKAETPAEWKSVEQAMGRSGKMQPGDVFKFSMPRSDLKVTAGGVSIKPGLALGSWVAFKKMGDHSMAMGDLVLTEAEVEPVMKKLQESGIEETALHNHLLGESPRVLYMHIRGVGDPEKIATAIHAALALTKTPPTSPPGSAAQKVDIDEARIEQVLGHKGTLSGGLLQFSILRTEKIMDGSMEVPPAMGVATAINFQPTGSGRAAITGDFVLLGSEVNPVIRALRENNIAVTAFHSHMLTEEPRLFFLHFWANDDAVKLAQGLRAALDKTNSKK